MAGGTKRPPPSSSSKLKSVSPAEFFATNREIAGFDNPGKCLFTTVRELVENSLDAAESARVLPDIRLTVEEVGKEELDRITGVKTNERIDEALYIGFNNNKKQKKQEAEEGNAPKAGKEGKGKNTGPEKRKREIEESYFRVSCKDNGKGMPHEDIPNMLGKVLSSTNYCLRQTRGKYGLGAKMALIWAKMSTHQPIEVHSATPGQRFISHYILDIDVKANHPIIIKEEKLPNPSAWQGAEVQVTIQGNWKAYGHRIVSYFRQLAVITPYSQFDFAYKALAAEKSLSCCFQRRTDTMPEPPEETNYHPSAVDLHTLGQLLRETRAKTLLKFLTQDFDGVGKVHAQRLIAELGGDFDEKLNPKQMDDGQKMQIHNLFSVAKFDPPSGECLSPAGEYNLRLGIMKEVNPVLIATHQGNPGVFQGHSFQVEAGVSIGGKNVKTGDVNVHRFANRIPLLFEPGSDVCTAVAKNINWGLYKINPKEDKVSIFVSIVSTKIPFRGTSKESISSESTEIFDAVKSALQVCGKQLRTKITKAHAARDRQKRKKDLELYVPTVASSLFGVLETLVEHEGKKEPKQLSSQDAEVVQGAKSGKINEQQLIDHLLSHIERFDTELELDYAEKVGVAEKDRSECYFNTLPDGKFGKILHASGLAIRLLQG